MFTGFWSDFFILFSAAILGSIAILPYGLRLAKSAPQKKPITLSQRVVVLVSILQNSVLFALVIFLGLITSHHIGVYISPLQTTHLHLIISFIFGIVAGAVLLVLDLFFLPFFPDKLLKTALKTTQFENFTASFYGGINEELLMRFFGLSVIVWFLSRMWHTTSIIPTTGVFWLANLIMAILFALGHLPALKALIGKISSVILARTLLLNMVVGLLCGWLYWNYGIATAIIAHFAADIIYHIGGTTVLRLKNQQHD